MLNRRAAHGSQGNCSMRDVFLNLSYRGLGDGSVDKGLAVEAWESGSGSPAANKKAAIAP